MKLYCLSVVSKSESGTACLAAAHELSSFGYFQRSSVKEFMDFSCKILVERTLTSSRSSVKEQEYICHVYVRSDNLAGVVIADHEYPQRVAHTLLNKALHTLLKGLDDRPESFMGWSVVLLSISTNYLLLLLLLNYLEECHENVLEEFSAQYSKSQWSSAKQGTIEFTQLETLLQKYQNPKEADAMTRIQSDLDETKIILHNTIEAVLQRGEKLDDLVDKSEVLGMQSKAFYKTAKKTNQCCVIL